MEFQGAASSHTCYLKGLQFSRFVTAFFVRAVRPQMASDHAINFFVFWCDATVVDFAGMDVDKLKSVPAGMHTIQAPHLYTEASGEYTATSDQHVFLVWDNTGSGMFHRSREMHRSIDVTDVGDLPRGSSGSGSDASAPSTDTK